MAYRFSPRRTIFEAPFDALVDYVETVCAEKEMIYKREKYSRWTILMYKALPVQLNRSLRRSLGERYVSGIASIEEEDYMFARETYKKILELYTWYRNDYPLMLKVWEELEKTLPEICYVDPQGNKTHSMFTDGELNRMDDQYIRSLKHYVDMEMQYEEDLEEKLQTLLAIRNLL